MREAKEWVVQGFTEGITEKINSKLMDDKYSYWFRFRTIPWYRRRKIKGLSPKETIEKALSELQICAKVWWKDDWKQISSYWIIEPE
jgi:hypothetical protein